MQIIACIFETASYIALGAFAGFFACFLDLIKVILYYKTDKDKLIVFATLPFYIAFAIFSVQEEGWIALLPAIGGVIDGYVLTRNKTTATIGAIISSSLWIIYDIVVLAFAAAFADSILVMSNFFVLFLGYSHILHINRLHVIKCRYLTHSITANIISLDRSNFSAQYLWSVDQQRNIFKLDPDSILLIRNKKHIIGYVNYISITKEAYDRYKRAHTFYKTINSEDIAPLRRRRKNYIIIESISINKSYESDKIIDLISKHLRSLLRYKHKQGYNIHGIISVGISDFEKNFLDAKGFTHLKDYRDGEALYELDDIAVAKYAKN